MVDAVCEVGGRWRRHNGGRRQPHREGRARTGAARDGDVAAHHLAEDLADGKSEARAAVFARGGCFGLRERLEESCQLLWRHADAGISHREGDQVSGGRRRAACGKRDGAARRELAGIGQQIEEDLADPRHVGADHAEVGGKIECERIPVLVDERSDGGRYGADGECEFEVLEMQFHPPGLDLGEVEHVVDQRQQVPAGVADLLQVGDVREVPLVGHLLLQHLAVADDRVERRTEFMAHARQELALRGIRGLGLAPGLQQFGDVVIHRHQAERLAVDDDRHAEHFDVDERSVLAPPSTDHFHWPLVQRLLCVGHRLTAGLGRRDQIVEVATDHVLLGVAEQPLERGVALDDVVPGVERDDRDRAVEHQLVEVLPLLPGRGEEPCVLHRDRRLRGEEPEQAQVLRSEDPLGIRVDPGDRADESRADQQGHRDDGLHCALRVAAAPRLPLLVPRHDQRLARLRHAPHRAFAEHETVADGVRTHLAAGHDHQRTVGLVECRQLPATHTEQRDGAPENAFEHRRQLEFA